LRNHQKAAATDGLAYGLVVDRILNHRRRSFCSALSQAAFTAPAINSDNSTIDELFSSKVR
jgi:hypothetical protein